LIAKPRLASTVIVIDKDTHPMRVLLIKRPETLRAFGGIYAFPGGTLDEQDHAHDDLLFYGSSKQLNIEPAYYIAAAREMFEEVGLLPCVDQNGSPVTTETDWSVLVHKVLHNELSFHQMLKERKWFINLPAFHYFGHRMTSLERPYRFNTRFFIVEMMKGQTLYLNVGEVESAIWITPQEALTNYKANKFKMVPPTLQSLETLAKASQGPLPELQIIDYTEEYY
jgi:8-oxo-dGTP pyrophosphatase MutT (NUDIX family)